MRVRAAAAIVLVALGGAFGFVTLVRGIAVAAIEPAHEDLDLGSLEALALTPWAAIAWTLAGLGAALARSRAVRWAAAGLAAAALLGLAVATAATRG